MKGRKSGFSSEELAGRVAALPVITFPEELPVSARREDIAQAIENHQVVIVSGETGSGKTTQLPKICLQLGRGIRGMIGHTQPRRLAARTVADRIADELSTKVGKRPGDVVGYQVRFTDEVGPTTLVKLMTDGILLAEVQNDPNLDKYDTIIIDEAHERSLNIDFLIGYLTRLLPKRPDLKVIITSATIDSNRFADHFAKALGKPVPVVEVSGRTYPVEIRYRPLEQSDPPSNTEATDDAPVSVKGLVLEDADAPLALLGYGMGEDIDYLTGICEAVEELIDEGPGDILVFLPGERDIRDATHALSDSLGPRYIHAGDATDKSPANGVEVLPLYSRLSAPEQQRIFKPHPRRRVVLATNVAETSLTVPGIRYVVDPGLARISRYSNRTKVQRLPIEPVSQASANQRSGRCGRVSDGVAIRLYSQADFEARPRYTEPEILRTSLASVILQMISLGLGAVEDFPFLDAPAPKAVRDGVGLLEEIGAVRRRSPRDPLRLTRIGRQLARLPIDPRLGRMLIEADREGVASEVLIIVAALSMQDVRERPEQFKDDADRAHERFLDPESDFITYLSLWRYLRLQSRELSGTQFRKMCKREFLHFLRWREWQDVAGQLRDLARPLGLKVDALQIPSRKEVRDQEREGGAVDAAARATTALTARTSGRSSEQIHRALLVGLLSNLGSWDQATQDYQGARGTRFVVWPGSGLARKHYDWVMAAELVETSRLFARTVAKIQPEWVEKSAKRLLKHSYSQPYWSSKMGAAMVREKVMLYGLTLVADRPLLLANVPQGAKVEAPTNATSIAARAGVTGGELGGSPQQVAREMFIQHALVDGEWNAHHKFVRKNSELLVKIHEAEKKLRQGGTVSDDAIFAFYDERVPREIVSAAHFDAWWRRQRDKRLLEMERADVLPGAREVDQRGYPAKWHQGDITLPLHYEFDPGSPRDGLTVRVPVGVLPRLHDAGFEWLVPGMLEELLTATIRALPKQLRAQLVPAPDVARELATWIKQNIWMSEDASSPSPVHANPDERVSASSGNSSGSTVSAAIDPESAGEDEVDPRSLEASLGRLAAWASKSGTANQKSIAKMKQASARSSSQSQTAPTSKREPVSPTDQQTQNQQLISPEQPQSDLENQDKPRAKRIPGTQAGEFLPHYFDAFVRATDAVKGVDVPRETWNDLTLPSHVTPMFVVVNTQGRELRSGEDLTWLQKQLSGQSQKAVRSAMREALDQAMKESGAKSEPSKRTKKAFAGVQASPQGRASEGTPASGDQPTPGVFASVPELDGLSDWPVVEGGALPLSVDARTQAGLSVRAFPALVPQGSASDPSAGVRVIAERTQADTSHRKGLAHLVLARTRLATARVSTRWTGREALILASGPYPDTESLVADAQLAAVASLIDEYETPAVQIRSKAQFEALAGWVQDRIEDRTYLILGWAVEAFAEFGELDRVVRAVSSPAMVRVLADVREHSRSLVFEGFLTRVPFEWLQHIARFVKADRLRVEKTSQSASVLARDEGLWRSVKDVEAALASARAALPVHEVTRAAQLDEALWLVEELRVSLFAQELGTSRKVSLKRLYAMLNG
ncbi:ATP-dependent RNA helicase HrpA [uncultured Actinomyces sp.]|uniref:ATP-dependent RNA helicase HrpA n=1 Tax=uncultured Actinomyces sp. TaxID=249061 RepID=UPI00288A60F2|nr:ATP-dependent RNA helicase HrpA [uncultured Actinomyces sp.]